jgi:hypothetical protein
MSAQEILGWTSNGMPNTYHVFCIAYLLDPEGAEAPRMFEEHLVDMPLEQWWDEQDERAAEQREEGRY